MSKTRAARGLLDALLVFFLAACGPAEVAPSIPPLKVAWTFREGDYTLLVAQQMGFFDEHNVEVEPVLYDSTARSIPDLAGAEIDASLLSMGELILGSSVADLKGVMVYDSGPVYSVVASPDIASIAQLRDRRLGVNLHSSSGMFVAYMLERAMLTSRQVILVEMSPEEVVQNIPEEVDAGLVWEPFTTQALQQGNELLFRSDVYSALVPGLIVFRTAIVEQYPDKIRAFLLAWNDAVEYRLIHPQEAQDLISQATGLPGSQLGITGDDRLYTIQENIGLFAEEAGTDPSSIYYVAQFNLAYIISLGDITNPPDLQDILDPSYLR